MKIERKEIKLSAKKHFKLSYGWLLLLELIHTVIGSVASSLYFVSLFIAGPLNVGLTRAHIDASKEKEVTVPTYFSGFKNYGITLAAGLLVEVFTFLWSLLLIVPGIIKGLSYSLTYYILAVDDKIGPNEARKLSMQMMKGYKGQLFVLYLSFIGWALLSILTFGVLAFFYTDLYLRQSLVEFKEKVYNAYNKTEPVEPVKETKQVEAK